MSEHEELADALQADGYEVIDFLDNPHPDGVGTVVIPSDEVIINGTQFPSAEVTVAVTKDGIEPGPIDFYGTDEFTDEHREVLNEVAGEHYPENPPIWEYYGDADDNAEEIISPIRPIYESL